jgi:Secretion system C-terminal sorting domain
MNRILCFLFAQLLAPLVLSAQEQITNFENQTEKSPKHIRYVGKVRDNALFHAWTPELGQNGNYILWTTDGTATNTYPLKKDEYTYLSGGIGLNCYNYFYFYNGRTDGKTFEPFTKPFYGLMKISDKLYSLSQDSLFYIDSLNNSTLLESKIRSFREKNGILFYIKTDTTDAETDILYRFQDEKSKAITELSVKDNNNYSITDVYTLGDYDYYFMAKSSNVQLIKINKKTNTTTLIDWGQNTVIGYYTSYLLISDSKNTTTYFVRYPNDSFVRYPNDSIEVYQPHTDGTLTKLLADKLENVAPTELIVKSSNGIYRGNLMLTDNLFISTSFSSGMSAIRGYRINCYNLLTKEVKTSIDLWSRIFPSWYPPKITPLTNDLYKIANRDFSPEKEYIYSFKANAIVDSVQYIDGTVVSLRQNQRVAFLDNVYNVSTDNVKTPLIKTDTFASNKNQEHTTKILKDKLLIWKLNAISQVQELYISGGNKHDTKLIKTFENASYIGGFQEFNDKIYFYLNNAYGSGITLYSTDGTSGGTQKITTIEGGASLDKVAINQNYLFYTFDDFRNNKYPRKTLVISKNAKTPLILEDLLPEKSTTLGEVVLTPSQLYYYKQTSGYNLFAIYLLKNNKLTLISNSAEQQHFVYQDKLIYIEKKTVGSIIKNNVYSLDDNQKKKNLLNFNGDFYFDYSMLGDIFFVKKYPYDPPYTYFYYNFSTQKSSTYTSQQNYVRAYFVNDYTVILDKNKIATLRNGKENVFPLAFTYTDVFLPYKNGFLFIYNSETDNIKTLAYFDLAAQKLTTIFKDYTISLTSLVEKNDAYVLFHSSGKYDDFYSRKHYYWLFETNATKEVPENRAFSRLSTNLFGQTKNNEFRLWNFERNTFVEKQRIANINSSNIFPVNNGLITFQTTLEKGTELVKITLDSITHYPEIVKGPKGIESYPKPFFFNNNLYLSAFTYTNGWQIWKIESDIDKKGFLPLSNEENDVSIKIYPNPTEDNITIETPDFFNYKLVNIMGQEMLSGSFINKKDLIISHLPQGLYLLWFRNGKTTVVKKVIKK